MCNYFCYPVPPPPSWSCKALTAFQNRQLKITIVIIIMEQPATEEAHLKQVTENNRLVKTPTCWHKAKLLNSVCAGRQFHGSQRCEGETSDINDRFTSQCKAATGVEVTDDAQWQTLTSASTDHPLDDSHRCEGGRWCTVTDTHLC